MHDHMHMYSIIIGMKILFAYYGVSCASGHLDQNKLERTIEWAKGVCDGQNSCRSNLHTLIQMYGDPYPGCGKDFSVEAQCPSGQVISDLVTPEAGNHDKFFSLQCPTQQSGKDIPLHVYLV